MTEFAGKYINPFTDYGFKKLFGEEPNKDLLLDFLNELLKKQIFEKLFETAEIARFTPDQIRSYEDSLKYYRDLKNSLDTAKVEGKIEIAKKMIAKGYSISDIRELTGLPEQLINELEIQTCQFIL